jgi:hypothetical protein
MIESFSAIGSKLQVGPGADEMHWFDPADYDLRRSTRQLAHILPTPPCGRCLSDQTTPLDK